MKIAVINAIQTLGELDVRLQWLAHWWLSKDRSVRYVTEQQFYGNRQLLHLGEKKSTYIVNNNIVNMDNMF